MPRRQLLCTLPLLIGIGLGASACTMAASNAAYPAGFAYEEEPYPFGLPGSGDFNFDLDWLTRHRDAGLDRDR